MNSSVRQLPQDLPEIIDLNAFRAQRTIQTRLSQGRTPLYTSYKEMGLWENDQERAYFDDFAKRFHDSYRDISQLSRIVGQLDTLDDA